MHELNAEIPVSEEVIRSAVLASGLRFFAAVDDEHIYGCASPCVFMGRGYVF